MKIHDNVDINMMTKAIIKMMYDMHNTLDARLALNDMFWLRYCLYPPKQALDFTCLHYKSFENTVGKGEIARNEQFLIFPQCFLATWRIFCHFHKI